MPVNLQWNYETTEADKGHKEFMPRETSSENSTEAGKGHKPARMAKALAFTPPKMDWEATNLPDELARFKQYCSLIFTGPFADLSDKERVSYILLWIDRQGVDIYNSWSLPDSDKEKPDVIWDRFEKHLAPKVNYRLARFQLQQLVQKSNEPVDDFITRCRNQAAKCKFRDATEVADRLIEQIIKGTKHKRIQEKLLQDESLSLDKAIDIARTYEATLNHIEQLHPTKEANAQEVHAVDTSHKLNKATRKCPYCGGNHTGPRNKCPAFGSTCRNCALKNHWATVCRKKNKSHTASKQQLQTQSPKQNQQNKPRKQRRQFNYVGQLEGDSIDQPNLDEGFESLTFGSILTGSKTEAFANITVKLPHFGNIPTTLRAKVDTGAQGNILPIRVYKQMFPQNMNTEGQIKKNILQQRPTVLTAYGGGQIPHEGICELVCEVKGTAAAIPFYVTKADGPAIVGLESSQKFGLVTLNYSVLTNSPDKETVIIGSKEDLISQYPKCFNGIGKFQGQYHISLDPSVPPSVHAPRRIPIALKDAIKAELDDMEAKNIITKVREGEPTAWVNSLVYRKKQNGRLRICLDPKDLNMAIRRDHHVVPTLEDLLPKLHEAKLFSIVDAKCGYWNVELDKESSYLTTFNSPYGRYRFQRMPFGLKMAQDVFQSKIDQTFEGCSGVIGISDDIVVFGRNEEEHDRNMHLMMKRCQATGLKLNPEKCRVKQHEIKFYGIICNGNGTQPDPAKVSALKEMKPPADTKQLQTFLGLATTFIPNLSAQTAPLRELVKDEAVFDWTPAHQNVFDQIKNSISDNVSLAYFDPREDITLQVDASLQGLGAVLLQRDRPIAFASKALTDTETRYANIERELLAVVYGCERFHTYLYGQSFVVETDHKPLVSIHIKHLTSAPQRLQRMLLRLQPYDITIKYKPGKEMLLADPLSRLSPEESGPITGMEVHIHDICPQFTEDILGRIKTETKKDSELNALKDFVYSGWPSTQKELPTILKPYWPYRDELALEAGILLKGSRVIIPETMQPEILKKLHMAHQGTEKTKLRARTSVFWRNLNKDIDEMTKACLICQQHLASQVKEPIIQTEIPPRAWHTIGSDLFFLNDEEYLLVSDYYSKFSFVRKTAPNQSTSKNIVNLMKQIFSEHGIPKIIRSDNGPQYSGQPFKQFALDYGFTHQTSSPNYPRSNGFIESQVKVVKRTLKKAQEAGTDPYIALLCLHSTPIGGGLPSPAELLFRRTIQDNLPRKHEKCFTDEDTINKLTNLQQTQKFYHDRHVKPLTPLIPGQSVTVQNPRTHRWEPATVQKSHQHPRSYDITTQSGQNLRRNRRHLRESNIKSPSHTDPVPDDLPTSSNKSQNAPVPSTPKVNTLQDARPTKESHLTTRSGRVIKPPERLITKE